jgi:hypothetical protein
MKSVASIVNKKVKLAFKKALDNDKDCPKVDHEGEKYIMSLVQDAVNKHTAEAKLASTVAAPVQATTQKVTLQSILKQAKNRAGGSS